MFKKIALIFLISTSLSACSLSTPSQENSQTPTEPEINTNSEKEYSLEEIGLHNSEQNCWLLIDGKVYDVTKFIPKHPGGQAIIQGCGVDATELFNTRPMGSDTPHSDKAQDNLDQFYIGKLK